MEDCVPGSLVHGGREAAVAGGRLRVGDAEERADGASGVVVEAVDGTGGGFDVEL